MEMQCDNTNLTSEKCFALKSKSFEIKYQASPEGVLTYKMEGPTQSFPLAGELFPGRTAGLQNRHQQCPRYSAPLSIFFPDGTCVFEPRYSRHTIEQETENICHTVIFLSDPCRPIEVEYHIRAYHDEDIFEQWVVVTNTGGEIVFVKRLDSLYLQGEQAEDSYLEWFESCEGSEARVPEREKLRKGTRLLENHNGNRHVSGPEPFFCLGFGAFPEEEEGLCLTAALSWSGSSSLAFSVNTMTAVEISAGMKLQDAYPLNEKESLCSPSAVFCLSETGKGSTSRCFHRWMRRYGLRDGNRIRLIDNNSWEGCGFEVSESAVDEMMKMSADLGIELYVMDDGWFGNGDQARINDKAGLGDWQLNAERFPNGLSPLLEAGKRYGIEFGIWFEPEMINPNSELFKQHPEWVMKYPGRNITLRRNQAILDVANPEVQEFMYHAVADILAANLDIRFAKWDANSSVNDPYSPYIGDGWEQPRTMYSYMTGYYSVMEKLTSRFPQVDFQACSAGGGRSDLGALKFSHTFWPSDNTDPSYRLGAVWNFSTCLPPIATTCHVTRAGGDTFTPKYRFDVATLGQLGMEVDPRRCSEEYLSAAQTGIAEYKRIREIIQFGDQYRHQSPFESSTPSQNFVSENQKRAVLVAFQTGAIEQTCAFSAPVKGLSPHAKYKIVELNLPKGDDVPRLAPETAAIQTGKDIMANGIALRFNRQYDSALILLEEQL
jgi:alpha-galactosidase